MQKQDCPCANEGAVWPHWRWHWCHWCLTQRGAYCVSAAGLAKLLASDLAWLLPGRPVSHLLRAMAIKDDPQEVWLNR